MLPDHINIVGIDISEGMLARAKEKRPNAETQLMLMNAEQLDFKNESFDVVVLHLILSVVEHPNQALMEALRVVKQDGRILIFDKFLPNGQNPSIVRKLFNIFSTTIGTDINRNFGEISKGVPFRTITNERSISGGYRIIVLAKSE
ncbi:class I SAM-dependent methyltransferase [Halobacillus amylolyticus]|uniref:Class I SAM-dependent methyltransferase n=1 Tax=Halobacillus amylolyticus TaxID=2932259 RepID=A0ABY4HCW4_9BACI|nr:class I SAM-dependent methyltransferase [Halobacillus amylolyticus]UOR12108.1 class I SAM-dependent methyltransferase [Halobacillus amylolyticus]